MRTNHQKIYTREYSLPSIIYVYVVLAAGGVQIQPLLRRGDRLGLHHRHPSHAASGSLCCVALLMACWPVDWMAVLFVLWMMAQGVCFWERILAAFEFFFLEFCQYTAHFGGL